MIPEYVVGQLVYSKSGRDKGRLLVVVGIEDQYLYLADGKLRKINRPKKKKIKHVQKTNYVVKEIKEKIQEENKLKDSDLRRVIKEYLD